MHQKKLFPQRCVLLALGGSGAMLSLGKANSTMLSKELLPGARPCTPCHFVIQFALRPHLSHQTKLGTGKRVHYERGLFTGGISRISKICKFCRISRNRSDSPLFSTVWGFSKISRISRFSRISRKWTFLKRPLFQKTPFSEPDKPLSWWSTAVLPELRWAKSPIANR